MTLHSHGSLNAIHSYMYVHACIPIKLDYLHLCNAEVEDCVIVGLVLDLKAEWKS